MRRRSSIRQILFILLLVPSALISALGGASVLKAIDRESLGRQGAILIFAATGGVILGVLSIILLFALGLRWKNKDGQIVLVEKNEERNS